MEQEDVRAIRDHFPTGQEDHVTLALVSLADYLRLEDDMARVGQALEVWIEGAQEALRRRDAVELARLLVPLQRTTEAAALEDIELAESGLAEGDEGRVMTAEKQRLVAANLRQVLDASVLRDLVRSTDEADVAAAQDLLKPFGGEAVDGVMDILGLEEDRGLRAMMVSLLVKLAPGHQDRVVARLSDERWYVVRNAITILRRSGATGITPMLIQVSRHANPAVRKEAIWGLVASGPGDALPVLRRLATDADVEVRRVAIGALGGMIAPAAAGALADIVRTSRDSDDRQRALEELGRHPSPDAIRALAELAARGKPRVPRKLRKQAKALMKQREGAR